MIHLKLGDCVSLGTHHRVFEVDVRGDPGFQIPPLVIKVALEGHGRRLAEEAAMYTHLRPLQGVVIPRCYGYFRCYVNRQQHAVMPWEMEVDFPRQFDEFRMPHQMESLNILLLERLGRHVAKKPVPEALR